MRKNYFIPVCFMIFLCFPAPAQDAKVIKVNQDTNIARFFNDSRWLFPRFEEGTIFLTQNRTQATVNYDFLTEQVFFINAKNDTLALQNAKDIIIIQVGKRYLKYYSKAFVEVVHRAGDSELWLRRQIKRTDTQKTGAYGLPSATSSVTNINTINAGGYFKDIETTEWAKYVQRVTFYVTDGKNKTRVANKAGFLKTFPKKKGQIESYLKEQPVDFENLPDLKRLLDFCTD